MLLFYTVVLTINQYGVINLMVSSIFFLCIFCPFLDRRKWDFLNGTPEKRKELHASVHREEHRRRDLLFNRRLAYQRKHKLMADEMLKQQNERNKATESL